MEKKPITTLEGLIEALDEMLDVYGDLPVEAVSREFNFPIQILDVWRANDNSTRGNPDGVIQIAVGLTREAEESS